MPRPSALTLAGSGSASTASAVVSSPNVCALRCIKNCSAFANLRPTSSTMGDSNQFEKHAYSPPLGSSGRCDLKNTNSGGALSASPRPPTCSSHAACVSNDPSASTAAARPAASSAAPTANSTANADAGLHAAAPAFKPRRPRSGGSFSTGSCTSSALQFVPEFTSSADLTVGSERDARSGLRFKPKDFDAGTVSTEERGAGPSTGGIGSSHSSSTSTFAAAGLATPLPAGGGLGLHFFSGLRKASVDGSVSKTTRPLELPRGHHRRSLAPAASGTRRAVAPELPCSEAFAAGLEPDVRTRPHPC